MAKYFIAVREGRRAQSSWLARMPGMVEACSKDSLARACQASCLPWWPRSWTVAAAAAGDDRCTSIDEVCKQAFAVGRSNTVIIKPSTGSQGQGIALARSPEEVKMHFERLLEPKLAIIQEYVDPPLLLDGKKWDARIYALVLPDPFNPGKILSYLAGDGLVRVCVEPYEKPSARNVHRLTVHLTNYSLSKFSDKFDHGGRPGDASAGCKRTLQAVLGRLESEKVAGITRLGAWQALKALTRDTIAAMSDQAVETGFLPETWDGDTEVAAIARDRFHRCFHIVGLDVLFDAEGRPWLLEANCNPSVSIDEVIPLPGSHSRVEMNALFAKRKDSRSESKWGRPCRCPAHPRAHAHHLCPVDVALKIPVVEGALTIVQRASAAAQSSVAGLAAGAAAAGGGGGVSDMEPEAWAQATVFERVL
eukprot:TRINITY_DN32005_c0_g1_i2.p1 TRINITY_DN32005_c0_g1~~TRINITY_DN32005_c0_g1_i2.p1  ORF type:complete len:420 (+),score=70.75 TRINITY_DN32005_c0_g1_i2:492-1751(+)